MLKKFAAPIAAVAVVLALNVVIRLNLIPLDGLSEASQDYFLKPIPAANLVVVEPNYGHFYHPHPESLGDESGQILYRSLEKLKQIYQVQSTRLVRFERKGRLIPNLYVFVEDFPSRSLLADESLSKLSN